MREEAFSRFAVERFPLDASWLDALSCPVLRLDGRRDCGCLAGQVLAHLAESFIYAAAANKKPPD